MNNIKNKLINYSLSSFDSLFDLNFSCFILNDIKSNNLNNSNFLIKILNLSNLTLLSF